MMEWLQVIGMILLGLVVGNMIRRKLGVGGG